MSSGRDSPRVKYRVHEMRSDSPMSDKGYDVIDNRIIRGAPPYDSLDIPELPDFTKRPDMFPTNSSNDYFSNEHGGSFERLGSRYGVGNEITMYEESNEPSRRQSADSVLNKVTTNRPSIYNSGRSHSHNASVLFFSEDVNDEHVFNDIPLNEELDDFDYDDLDSTIDPVIEEESLLSENETDIRTRVDSPDPYYSSLGKDINRADSPFMQIPKVNYTTEIPEFYDQEKLKYPYKAPLDYTDEEFENMNHFEFLKDLNFNVPPLLPVYLNSNLLNDSCSKNYKTFPYQYQESTVPHVNEIYRYRINDLNTMDKYSRHQISRPTLKRNTSSNSSSSSSSLLPQRSNKVNAASNSIMNKAHLLRENSNGNTSKSKLKHSDKISLIERNLIPHHVMLNHLITCNLNKDGYLTSSCITRYKGKFITQIMYFSNELE